MAATAKQYATALYETLETASANDRKKLVQNFLRMLYNRGELSKLPEIVERISSREEADTGILTVVVTTARELSEAEAQDIAKQVTDADGAVLETAVDDNLIGGVIVETKNKRWDASVRGQIHSLKKHLTL